MTAGDVDPRSWREAIARFEALAELAPAEHERALADLAAADPDGHALVARLLAAGEQADGAAFLDPATGPQAREGEPDLAGRPVGPWELVRELGAGGMGRVWLARRRDGRFEGRAAVKLLKAPLAAGAERARFAREGRILAALAHPRIARLLDAGTLDDGQPYLVLEYVEGERIDRWCQAHGLDARSRVRLFLAACEAVAFAYANLVVHRDLKPSNILVTPAGEVKLLDFGIAKLLDEERGEGEETELTRLAGRALTPEYAAPEQVSGAPVTTATDVYSLGVVLYQLLAGRSPYAREDGSRPSAWELSREVIEREAPRLRGPLAGDLENIVARALKKPPAERYASAQALADDLRRYLEHRPVEARGDSAGYLLARFVRRHRAAVAAGALVATAVVAGVAGVAWQARIAREEGARAKAVSDFMADIFRANSTDNTDPAKARATTARELLDIGRARAARDLAANPEAHQQVLLLIGRLYYELDLAAEGAKVDRERIAVLRSLDGGGTRLAQAHANLAGSLTTTGDIAGAAGAAAEALALFEAAGETRDPAIGDALAALGNAQRYLEPAKAVDTLRRAAAFHEAHAPDTAAYAYLLRSLAVVHQERGELEEAAQAIDRGLAVAARAWPTESRELAFLLQVAGNVNFARFHPAAARAQLERAMALEERALGPDSSFMPVLEVNLARVERGGPGARGARERLEARAARLETVNPGGRRNQAYVLGALAAAWLGEGRLADARAAAGRALSLGREAVAKPILAGLLATAVEIEIAARDATAASRRFAELDALRRGPLASSGSAQAKADEIQAGLLVLKGDAGAARALLVARLARLAQERPAAPLLEHAGLRLALAEAEARSGQGEVAVRRAREILEAIAAHPDRAWFADLEAAAARLAKG